MAISGHEVYMVAGPLVISETIGDETVIIDLDRGCYFSLKGSGSLIWAQLQRPASVEGIVALLLSTFDVQPGEALDHIKRLLSYLVEENLVIRSDEPAVAHVPNEDLRKVAFVMPSIEKFTDMEAMLLLDPVHDVDEEGWPHRPSQLDQKN